MEIKENIAYWCQTEELAKKFLQECEKQKIRWHNGEKLIKTNWKDYKENGVVLALDGPGTKIGTNTNPFVEYDEKFFNKQ